MKAAPRVAIVASRFPAVSETFVVDHAIGMARRGWEPLVIARELDRAGLDRLREHGVPVTAVELGPAPRTPEGVGRAALDLARSASAAGGALRFRIVRTQLPAVPALRRVLAEFRPALVHAHFGPNGIYARFATELPLAVDFHGFDFTTFPSEHGWGVYRSALGGSELVVHSSFAETRIRSELALPIHRVALGVDLSRFASGERREWTPPLRMLVVGRLVPQKGHEVAIRALARLLRQRPRCAALRIVGDGPERANLERSTAELGVAPAVTFAGSRAHDEVADEMKAADVLVVPSRRGADGSEEAFGRVAIEGLAAGLAVIASDSGGLAESVRGAGWIVPPDDPAAIADVVEKLLDTADPAAWSARARLRAEQFSIERMWDEYAEVAAKVSRRS